MSIGPNRFLSLLTFPQSWDGTSLTVRFLCLPKGDPFQPLQPGLPSFSSANIVFEAKMIGSLARLPQPADATSTGPLVLEGPPLQKIDLFTELTTRFTIRPSAPPCTAKQASERQLRPATSSSSATVNIRRCSPAPKSSPAPSTRALPTNPRSPSPLLPT